MSTTNGLTNSLGPGMPMPGGEVHDVPQGRRPGASGTPGGGGSPAPQLLRHRMPTGLEGATQALVQGHGQAKAAYEETSKALVKVDYVRQALDRLADKGDMVTPEGVIAEASKLVAHGLDPAMLAGILADMPQEGGGEALGAWVTGHAVTMAQMEQQLSQARAVAQHNLGVAAVHVLTAHDVGRAVAGPEPEAPATGGNSLGGQGAPPGPTPMGGSLGLGQMSGGQGPGSGGQGPGSGGQGGPQG